jgi:predicted Fe-S protein YdhL (DUF1289 family)
MAIYPKIQSPCPYIDRLSTIMDGDMCRMCKRQVFDLTDMSDGERVAFMKGCSGEVCVSYKFSVRPAIAAAALAVAAFALPAAAAACDATEDVLIVTGGGIRDTANVQFVENPADNAVPELPVVYDDKQTASKDAKTPGS